MSLATLRSSQYASKVKISDRHAKQFEKVLKNYTESKVGKILGKHTKPMEKTIADNWDAVMDDDGVYSFLYFNKARGEKITPRLVLRYLVGRLSSRLPEKTFVGVQIYTLNLTVHPGAEFYTEYRGQVYSGKVSGMTALSGTFMLTTTGTITKVFTKFITHPFFQYSSCLLPKI